MDHSISSQHLIEKTRKRSALLPLDFGPFDLHPVSQGAESTIWCSFQTL